MQKFSQCDTQLLQTLPFEQMQIITANNRLAVFIKEYLIQGAQRQVIALPRITPYKSWLDQLAQQRRFRCQEVPLPLDEFSQQWLWRQAIEEVEKEQPLLSISQAAANASQAHRQLAEWAIQVLDDEKSQEYERFMLWREVYGTKRDALSAWDTPQIIQASLTAIQEGLIQVPPYIFLSGFYAYSPQQLSLLEAMQARGCEVRELLLPKQHATQITVYTANDDKHELESAVIWAKQTLLDNPDKHVALVCPNLQSEVAYVRRILELHFAPMDLAYHVAVGRPLNEWPLVRSVMQWLSLCASLQRSRVSVQEFGKALLLACFGASTSELARLLELDVELRNGEAVECSPSRVIEALYQYAPNFAAKFEVVFTSLPEQKCGSSEWVQFVRDSLVQLGFPGPQALSSENFQVCHAFEGVLKKLASLDEVLGQLSLEQLLTVLQQLLMRTMFQAKRAAQARLDVVGLYEIEGGQWDAAWLLGLHDDALPSMAKPNPFIPVSSQRRAQVLHATPESEMQWSKQIFESVLHAVPQLILSWPLEKDSQIMRPSSFLGTWPMQELGPIAPRAALAVSLETIEDSQGLAAQAGDFRGGYRALDLQARNPLWSYAYSRLGIEALRLYPSYELNHLNRGNFYHRSLELVWKGLEDSTKLKAYTNLDKLLEQCIQMAAKETLKALSSPALRHLEQQRAQEIIHSLLEKETEREDFSVEQMELRVPFQAYNLKFNFTIDRIDRLADGRRVYIDYKTGSLPSNKELARNWFERERPIDVQLPLYASSLGLDDAEAIGAVSFVGLKRGAINYLGVGTSNLGIPKSVQSLAPEQWQTVVQTWHDKITGLVNEIAQGQASNRYENIRDMQYCSVMPFLRCHLGAEGEGDE